MNLMPFTLSVAGILLLSVIILGLLIFFLDQMHLRRRLERLQVEFEESFSTRKGVHLQEYAERLHSPSQASMDSVPAMSTVALQTTDILSSSTLESVPLLTDSETPPIDSARTTHATPPPVVISSSSLSELSMIGEPENETHASRATLSPSVPTKLPELSLSIGAPEKHVIYLDPEFEQYEVTRVLQLWQMHPVQVELRNNQVRVWTGDEGNQVELYEPDDSGFPFLVLRGPMAEDLAEFLPQDLPIHPLMSTRKPDSQLALSAISAAPVPEAVPFSEEEPKAPLSQPSMAATIPSPELTIPSSPVLPEGPSQILYLDPEFELSEVKRVLRIWQMSPEDDLAEANQLGRWIGSDGTSIQLFSSNTGDGFPYLELRGPMAEDLAEFLPQDLPIHPGLQPSAS